MTVEAGAPWLLDTSILVNVLRATPVGRHLVEEQQIRARQQAPVISVVTVGELLSLARQFQWGERKIAYMRQVLAELVAKDT